MLLLSTLLAQTQGFAPDKGEVIGDVPTIKGLEVVFSNVILIALSLAGIVLFIMLIIGGFKYATAGDNAASVEAARKTVTSALMGIFFMSLAYLVIKLIEYFTGAPITNFIIYQP